MQVVAHIYSFWPYVIVPDLLKYRGPTRHEIQHHNTPIRSFVRSFVLSQSYKNRKPSSTEFRVDLDNIQECKQTEKAMIQKLAVLTYLPTIATRIEMFVSCMPLMDRNCARRKGWTILRPSSTRSRSLRSGPLTINWITLTN